MVTRRGPRGDLSRAVIVEAATGLVREKGAAALTLRGVASRLGVAPNALYTYVADLPTLRNAVGDEFLAMVDLTPLGDPGLPLEQSLRRFMTRLWTLMAAEPGLAAVVALQPIVGPGALALNEALLQRLTSAGLALAEADEAVQALTAWLYGSLVLHDDDGGSPYRSEALSALSPEDYPLTVARTGGGDELPGLGTVLRGITG